MSELRSREKIPIEEAVDWVLQACAGLAHAHARGILHRDIKPSNLFLCEEATGPVVKIMDFGVSKIVLQSLNETEITTTETTVGTPTYMAPEQLVNSRTVDHRADLWSLGVVLYRMLSGTLPFRGATATATAVAIATTRAPSLAQVAPTMPAALVDAVMRALEPDVTKRHADTLAFGRAIEPFGSGRFPFEAAVQGVPPPAMSGARVPVDPVPRMPRPPEAAAPAPPAAVRLAPSESPPRGITMPVAIAVGAVVSVVLATGIVLAVRSAARATPSAPSAIASASADPSSSASSTFGAFAPPPSLPTAIDAPSPTASTSSAPSSPPSATKPPASARGPASAKPPRGSTSAPPPKASAHPPDDPLHL
jgi:serine/threonine-protein kinase